MLACQFYPSGGAPAQLASGYIVGTLHRRPAVNDVPAAVSYPPANS